MIIVTFALKGLPILLWRWSNKHHIVLLICRDKKNLFTVAYLISGFKLIFFLSQLNSKGPLSGSFTRKMPCSPISVRIRWRRLSTDSTVHHKRDTIRSCPHLLYVRTNFYIVSADIYTHIDFSTDQLGAC